ALPAGHDLNGQFDCAQVFAFYPGAQGTAWYTASCNAYVTKITNPSRAGDIETLSFHVTAGGQVTRAEFDAGTLQYDTASGEAVVSYDFKSPDDYFAQFASTGKIQLKQLFTPFDYTGDGKPDSLIVIFQKQ